MLLQPYIVYWYCILLRNLKGKFWLGFLPQEGFQDKLVFSVLVLLSMILMLMVKLMNVYGYIWI